jgi:myo-inositol-1-phosphate synthase
MISKGMEIAPASGRLGVVLPGMGAVCSTFIAGVEAVKKGLAKPIGSRTQMEHPSWENARRVLSSGISCRSPHWMTSMKWDLFPTTFIRQTQAGVLERSLLDSINPWVHTPW